jgi:hypothetical protein
MNRQFKKVLRFFKSDLDIDTRITFESLMRELEFSSIYLKTDDMYELYGSINRFITNSENKNFFLYKFTGGEEPIYIHITF